MWLAPRLTPEDTSPVAARGETMSAVPRLKAMPGRGRVLCETPGSLVFVSEERGGAPVVVKKIKIVDVESFDRFDLELEIMLRLRHPTIIRPVAVCDTPPNYAYVLPLMRHGSLYEFIHIRRVPLHESFVMVLLISLDLARAIEHAHSVGVVHRDIKPHNLLLGEDGVSLLTDFGLAAYERKLQEEGSTIKRPNRPSAGFKKIMGTFEYMAPELFQKKQHTRACDVYALGVSMNELITGQLPYMGAEKDTEEFYTVLDTRYDRISLMKAICTQDLRPDCPAPREAAQAEFVAILRACWAARPENRPSASAVVARLSRLAKAAGIDVNSSRSQLLSKCIARAPNVVAPKQYVKPRTAALPDIKFDSKSAGGVSGKASDKPLFCKAGVISTKGKRGYMEDYHVVKHNLFGRKDAHVFGVFDGHGGDGAARFVSSRLTSHLEPISRGKDPSATLKRAFMLLQHEFMESEAFAKDNSGTTALVALLLGRRLLVANVGDSLGVLSRGKRALRLNKEHTASDPDERELIEGRGGFVRLTKDGKHRTDGIIQLSRAIGDRKVARHITAEPEITSFDIGDDDEFMVLATDGLYDALGPQKVVNILHNTVKHADYGSKSIVADALQLGSTDNITAITCYFSTTDLDAEYYG